MTQQEALTEAAERRGLRIVDRGQGHFQIAGGPLLVNYYPLAKKRSAYVAGTQGRRVNVTPEQAVAMAFEPPPMVGIDEKERRKANYRNIRRRMLKAGNRCHWCRALLTLDTSTIDHVIPLKRGGLDNANNRVLACEPCNNKRGHDMTELTAQRQKGSE